MDPISGQVFSHDAPKYVFQDPNVIIITNHQEVRKPFTLDPPQKADKSKKDPKGKTRQNTESEDSTSK